ncbi:hypothetical protein PVAND_017767, partial [Polypedilum vanderplanki]
VIIEGNIGSGKTELLKALESKGFSVLYEPDYTLVHGIPLLKQYYEKGENTFEFQLYAMISLWKVFLMAIEKNELIFIERSILSSFHVFTTLLYQTNRLSSLQFGIIKQIFDEYKKHFPYDRVKKMIILEADEKEMLMRIRKRGRNGEQFITEELLKDIMQAYSVFPRYYKGLTYSVDTTNKDVNSVVEQVLNLI